MSNWKETSGLTKNTLERLYIPSGMGMPQDPPGEAGERTSRLPCLACCHQDSAPDKTEENEWIIQFALEF